VPVPARLTVNTTGRRLRLKVAVTCWFALSVTVQVLLLLQVLTDQPAKYEFVPAVAVSVTRVPVLKLAPHVGPQLIPEGLLEIVPWPFPARLTVNTGVLWEVAKAAVACWLPLIVNVQVGLLPLHPPAHPTKDEFVAAVAVRVT
jgi:hypothetical protein